MSRRVKDGPKAHLQEGEQAVRYGPYGNWVGGIDGVTYICLDREIDRVLGKGLDKDTCGHLEVRPAVDRS